MKGESYTDSEAVELDADLEKRLAWFIKNRKRIAWTFDCDSVIIDLYETNKVLLIKENKIIKEI
jgi:hypothetical protein